jgi:hypothetical protein
MRTKVLLSLLAAAALALPAAALADHGGGGGGGGKQANYELKGMLSAYTAAVGATNGSITIHVTKASDAGKPFVGMTLTFPVSSSTKVESRSGTIADGDNGEVQVKGAPGLDATGLQALAPKQIEDKGAGGGGPKPTTYELKGTLSAYTAAVGATNGSITILVTKANDAGKPFVGMTLTFPVSSTTTIDPTGGVIADGDRGEVQVKGTAGLDATGLQALTPKEIEDDTLGDD